MVRAIHVFIVASGFAMLAVVPLSFFYRPAWLVQQNAITLKGIAACFAFGLTIALGDMAFSKQRATRTAWQRRDRFGAHPEAASDRAMA